MIRALIVEDEVDARRSLIRMLSLVYPEVQVVGETGYVSDALTLLKSKKPDLLFLDIELEDGSGFDLLRELDTVHFKIIFVTAYSEYAIKAFKYSASDYLLKPISPLDLKEAIDRVVVDIETELKYKELQKIVQSGFGAKVKKIVLKTTEGSFVVDMDSIIRLEADASYTKFVTTEKNILVSKNIKYYQELLDDRFVRCHQSHVVNSSYIQGIKSNMVLLSNRDRIPVSIRKKSEIARFLDSI